MATQQRHQMWGSMRRICTLDLETDPFAPNRKVQPFLAGFYDGDRFVSFWGLDCVSQMVTFLESQEDEYLIFAHNGGKFDYFYFLPFIRHTTLKIINSRIVQAFLGRHELRDSYAILPFPLAAYKKTEIDYSKMEAAVRESNRDEIVSYLRDDCVDLHELVTAFFEEFGDKLTVGSSALKQLKLRHKFTCGGAVFDERFRKRFYFGGRCQVFRSGIIRGPVKILDVNSMYPYVMKAYLHPVGTSFELDKRIKKDTCFVVVEGYNRGAFPTRMKDNSLSFTVPYGRFYPTIHEFEASQDTGTFTVKKIIATYGCKNRITFTDFVDHFYDERNAAKLRGDKIHTLFYKFVLNSAYGKFAQNPENFHDYRITGMGYLGPPWEPAFVYQGSYIIWRKPVEQHHYNNITTGASITGAARACLLRGIAGAVSPLYCDTDSIICSDLKGVPIGETELGAWKVEATGNKAAISGKKIYAVFDGQKCVKKAHKGVRLTDAELIKIAQGETVTYENPVPSFKFDGSQVFTKRRVKRTS